MRIIVKTLDLRGFDQLKARVPGAVARAVSRAGDAANTVLVRLTAKDLKATQKGVRRTFSVSKPTETNPTIAIRALSRRLSLIALGARGPEPSRGKGRVRARGKTYPGAFIATTTSHHRGVFKRRDKARLPIVELHGPSPWKVALTHVAAAAARAQDVLVTRMQYEFGRLLNQLPR